MVDVVTMLRLPHRYVATLRIIGGGVDSKPEPRNLNDYTLNRQPLTPKHKPRSQTMPGRPSPRHQILTLGEILWDLPQLLVN